MSEHIYNYPKGAVEDFLIQLSHLYPSQEPMAVIKEILNSQGKMALEFTSKLEPESGNQVLSEIKDIRKLDKLLVHLNDLICSRDMSLKVEKVSTEAQNTPT